MTPTPIQKSSIYILHHGDSDGRFAGYAAWRYSRNHGKLLTTSFTEIAYGKPFPLDIEMLCPTDVVYILDFSYDRETLDRVNAKVAQLVVLDHHETGEENLRGADYAIFDMTKSGALLAWEYFFPNTEPPMPCLLANDFDLWAKQYGLETDAFEAWLRYDRVGQNWEKWENLCFHQPTFDKAMELGGIVAAYNKSIMDGFIKNPDNITLSSLFHDDSGKRATYAIFNGMSILHSELSEVVYTTFDVDMTISWRVKGKVIAFSIRTPNPEKFSAIAFATSYGGGGHPKAAAFALPLEKGMELVKHLMSKA